MALRAFLVVVVAALGFELPSGPELASWTQSGRDWTRARMADLSAFRADVDQIFNGSVEAQRSEEPVMPVEVASTRSDFTFEAVVEKLATDFSSDLAKIEEARPVVEGAIAARPVPVEASRVVRNDPEPEPSAVDPVPEPAPILESGSRVEKIASAIRLTRQAMDAWAAIVGPSTVQAAEDSF